MGLKKKEIYRNEIKELQLSIESVESNFESLNIEKFANGEDFKY